MFISYRWVELPSILINRCGCPSSLPRSILLYTLQFSAKLVPNDLLQIRRPDKNLPPSISGMVDTSPKWVPYLLLLCSTAISLGNFGSFGEWWVYPRSKDQFFMKNIKDFGKRKEDKVLSKYETGATYGQTVTFVALRRFLRHNSWIRIRLGIWLPCGVKRMVFLSRLRWQICLMDWHLYFIEFFFLLCCLVFCS